MHEFSFNDIHQYSRALAEYCRLSCVPELADEEADRLEVILTQAESDVLLNFLIGEIDYILGQRSGLLDANSIESYKNQQAWLREHLEQAPLEQEHLVAAQYFLREAGFYSGPIDGVWHPRTCQAAISYRKHVQQLLREQGLYDGAVDGELGSLFIIAVQAFQKSHDLKGDGVVTKQVFSILQNDY